MEYQKKINLLGNAQSKLSKFRTENCVEINGDLQGIYNTNSQIRFRT